MKKALILALFLCANFIASSAIASDVRYWLPKISGISFDQSPERNKPLFTIGLLYGYGLGGNFAIETEGNYGIYGGKYSTDTQKGAFSGWSLGSFLVFRQPFSNTRYLKLKGGGLYQHVENENRISSKTEEISEADMVLGIGAGRVLGSGTTLEFEYTRTLDRSHNLALAIYFPFGS